MNENAKIDQNYKGAILAVTDDANAETRRLLVDPATGRLLTSSITSYEGGPIIDGVTATIKATVFDYVNSNPLAVRLTDANGDYVASGAGEQYADGTVVNAAYKGNLILGTDGTNYQIVSVDSSGNVQVDIVSSASIAVTNAGITSIDGKITACNTGAVVIASGTITGITNSVAVTGTFWQATQPVSLASVPSHAVTNAGTFVVQENGAALTALQLIDNAVSGAGFNITQFGGAAVPIGAGLEATAIRVTLPTDGTGVVKLGAGTAEIGKLAANSGVDIGDVDVPGSTVAHDDADSGNPHKIGSKAVLFDGSAPPNAAVAEGDRTNAIGDEYGRLYVETTHPNYWSVSADYSAAQTNTSVKAAPGAGLSLYITDIVISNGATAGNITLLDGSGGAVKFEIYPAINGGASTNLRTPIKLTANTALCITSTTVTTHSINITGFIAP